LVLIDFGAVKQISTQVVKKGKTVSTIAIGTRVISPVNRPKVIPVLVAIFMPPVLLDYKL
jgi:hypothetical protein